MIIGVPKEIKTDEYRVALTPAGARELTGAGHRVLIERSAGVGSSIADADYVANGATIVDSADDVWSESELPIAAEYHRLSAHKNQVLFTYLHLAASRECTDALVAANNVAVAYETVRLRDNSLPLLTPMSEVAGRMAPLMAAHHLMRPGGGHGTLISGLAAATMAAGLHSNVKILDRNLERLRQVDIHFDGRVQTIASSTLALEDACLDADIVIGAVLVVGAKAPKLVSNELVARMRHGSVLVDISVDQGGCFEATHPTTHSDPVFEVNGSIFYCVANMPGAFPYTSTYALANATLPYAMELARHGWREAVVADDALAEGVTVVEGAVTYGPVAESLGVAFSPLRSLL